MARFRKQATTNLTPREAALDLLVREAKEEWLEGVETVGFTSGPSVPEILVKDLLQWLFNRVFTDVQTITAMEETLHFAMPPKLRQDLKAAVK